MIRVDLHLHTIFSGDSSLTPKFLVNQLHAHPFIKGVAITDHNTLEGYFQTRKLASAYEDLLILPGLEISTREGDLIILGVDEKPRVPIELSSAIEFAKANKGLVVIPHPYRSLGIGKTAMTTKADAIEVLNPTATPNENMLARNLAKAISLPGIAGTDAHDPKEMWTVYTEVEAQLTIHSILDNIRKGRVKAVAASPQG
ncbi:MAG: PHP domain-containing protein [Candidatus Bathyarchaeota archaeon]|nr:MAG: PHP domain-containing protein [Candidatus Bathyarchaeota archaeon]